MRRKKRPPETPYTMAEVMEMETESTMTHHCLMMISMISMFSMKIMMSDLSPGDDVGGRCVGAGVFVMTVAITQPHQLQRTGAPALATDRAPLLISLDPADNPLIIAVNT